MTRHDQCHRVGAACAADGAHRSRCADLARDVAVGAGLSARDAPQRVPDAALEHGAADVERYAREAAFAGDEGANAFFDLRHALLADLSGAELVGEQALEVRPVRTELHSAYAL